MSGVTFHSKFYVPLALVSKWNSLVPQKWNLIRTGLVKIIPVPGATIILVIVEPTLMVESPPLKWLAGYPTSSSLAIPRPYFSSSLATPLRSFSWSTFRIFASRESSCRSFSPPPETSRSSRSNVFWPISAVKLERGNLILGIAWRVYTCLVLVSQDAIVFSGLWRHIFPHHIFNPLNKILISMGTIHNWCHTIFDLKSTPLSSLSR